MAVMMKFPKIGQYRDAINNLKHLHGSMASKNVYFRGSVKLHGANFAVCIDYNTGEIWCQTRNRIIDPEDGVEDPYGFLEFISSRIDVVRNMFRHLKERGAQRFTAIYGEFAGSGIQKKAGICQLPDRRWFMFAVRGSDGTLDDGGSLVMKRMETSIIQGLHKEDSQIYSILKYPMNVGFVTINPDNPAAMQNMLGELTLKVEQECPVAKHFGITGTGEGIVWECTEYDIRFKVKGKKHSSSRVKTLAEVDLIKVQTITDFVDAVLTESRLEQGLDYLKEMGFSLSRNHTGSYLRWIANDVLTEESDTMVASGLTAKDVMPQIAATARNHFFSVLDTL